MGGPSKHPVQKSPTTSPMQLVDANSSRLAFTCRNAGTVRVYLDKDNTVSATSMYLDPGETLVETAPAISLDDWWGTTASGTGDLRIVEVY